jgi:hypothetical protein
MHTMTASEHKAGRIDFKALAGAAGIFCDS